MSFFDVVKQTLLTDGFPDPTFRALLIGDYACYLEDVCSILEFGQEVISVRLKKGGLKVTGKDLYIKKYCAGDLLICGKITAIERV